MRFEGLKINEDKAKLFQDFFCEVNCDHTHLKPPVLQAAPKLFGLKIWSFNTIY